MDRQSVPGVVAAGGAGNVVVAQEWLHAVAAGGGQPAGHHHLPQVVLDGAFLMELLEDAPAADHQQQPPPEDVERLSRVIRSLEAEIGGGGGPPAGDDGAGVTAEHVPASDVFGGGGLVEDCYMLSDLDSISGGGPGVAEAPFEYWPEVAPPALAHADMAGWYVDGDGGLMLGYEFREQCYYGYGESPAVEQVYSPLWE